uniref:Anaerobic selenocysteine-containing dehydrogenase n=1 Tax=Candidatus Kentrum sp. FM TaxID=2126340 RepID=A0A450TE48_9GAMM|nr:MAG: Anaerobic selenocysteine-containing dehydrogenase [Candidatus Kentron sp. FM]VFJ65314.1 MAG: Anaerobic selenocysteine-containing dehydrogenase [Candidatus Kentron sp. FM]VFK16324.1 MAG: Anaerobic selenocysteine-containing dehydrogenase [Candidatus Kentron sp. FM]
MKKHTVCRFCSACCPVVAEVADGRLVSAKRKSFLPEEKRLPCAKLNAAADIVYSPERLTAPLIRDDRGQDFREASWDEALDRVAEQFRRHKRQSGAHSIAWLRGMAADWGAPWDYPNRLMNLFGSPNTIGNGSICFVGRDMAHSFVYGSMAFPEPKNSKCIIVWGKNDRNTTLAAAEGILYAKEHGARLIVVDPVETTIARQADSWLRIKPGHDGLLAMAMIHEIIESDLYDKEFVAEHTIGFERLKKAAERFPAGSVAERIWLDADTIRRVARLYATTKPACIIDGNGLDMHRQVFDTTRAVAMLNALTGNLDKTGGNVLPQPVPVRNIQEQDKLPEGVVPITRNYPLFNDFSDTWGSQVQSTVIDGILDGKPYPVKMAVVQSGNPLVSMENSPRTRRAFETLDTLVVIDMFMTETARLAHVILPAASCFERTQLNRASIRNNPIILQNAVIPPVADAWPDWKIVFALGRRLGLEKEFPWESAEAAIDYQLEPTGVDVARLRENPNGVRIEELVYEKYRERGFKTPSGKVEFHSETLEKSGFPGTPFETGEIENPLGFAGQESEYPFLAISGSRDIRFTNSQFRNIPALLQNGAGCVVDIHPEDAGKEAIRTHEIVRIETPVGSIRMPARISTVVPPGMVRIAWGWGEHDPAFNLNNLTGDERKNPITGTATSRSFMCRITT